MHINFWRKLMTEEMLDSVDAEMDALEQEIQDAFTEGVEAGKQEDAIKLAMIAAGATFKNVTRLYNKFMIDAGLALSKSDRDAAIATIVSDSSLLVDEEHYNSCVAKIVEQIKGATERAAGAMLRAFAKANGVECFKRAKAEGGTRQSGFRFKFYNALRANPRMTEEEAEAFSQDDANGASDNDKKQFSHYQAIRQLINDVA